MSDIRMQSIFLDEEFVLEDKSDIDRYNAQRTNHDRQASIAGHNSKDVQNAAKNVRKREAQSVRGRWGDHNVDGKIAADDYNRISRDVANMKEEVRNRKRKSNKYKSRHESAIMDMIEII